MAKKIIILISLLAIAFGVMFVFFKVRQDSSLGNESKKIINEENEKNENAKNKLEEEKEDSPESTAESSKTLDPVSKSDCEEECSGYDTEKYRVACIEECELINVPREENDCEKISGTSKDSCWKEQALKEKNFSLCEKIENTNIKKSCKDRLTEEMLDSEFEH